MHETCEVDQQIEKAWAKRISDVINSAKDGYYINNSEQLNNEYRAYERFKNRHSFKNKYFKFTLFNLVSLMIGILIGWML